jgi:hypothetical protein
MFTSLKKIKYLGVYLIKNWKDLYDENCKLLKGRNERRLQEMERFPHAHGWAESIL